MKYVDYNVCECEKKYSGIKCSDVRRGSDETSMNKIVLWND